MSDSHITVPGTSDNLQTELHTVGGVLVHAEMVIESAGTFGYRFSILTSGNLTLTGRLRNLRVYAQGIDGTFNISGGDTITVRNGIGFDFSPRTLIDNPTINWVSGTLDVFAEMAT
jgi:hypothetical protein